MNKPDARYLRLEVQEVSAAASNYLRLLQHLRLSTPEGEEHLQAQVKS